MQKLLEVIRNKIWAKLFIELFIFNFFCMQTFGMFMGEGVNVRKSEDKQLFLHADIWNVYGRRCKCKEI